MAGGMGRQAFPGLGAKESVINPQWQCPGIAASAQQIPNSQAIEDQAKALAQQYAEQNLKGFTVSKVQPFTGMHMPMYSVELKGPEGQVNVLHVHPWGNVMPMSN
jgi:hypothetical protein